MRGVALLGSAVGSLAVGVLAGGVWAQSDPWGPEARVTRQLERLREGDDRAQTEAVWALRNDAPDAERAVAALVEALDSGCADVRVGAAQALAAIGGAGRVGLAEAFREGSARAREAALRGLVATGEEATPVFAQALRGPDVRARRLALRGLVALGERAEGALPAFAAVYPEVSAQEAHEIVTVWDQLDATQALVQALDDGRVAARVAAAGALVQRGAPVDVVEEALRAGLASGDVGVRFEALDAVSWLHEGAARLVPEVLVAVVESGLDAETTRALWARIGGAAAPALAEAIRTADPAERRVIELALGELGDEGLPWVLEELREAEAERRLAAAGALGELVERVDDPEVVVDALLEAALDTDPGVADAATAGLVAHAERLEPGVAELVERLGSRDDGTRQRAVATLIAIGEPAVPALQSALGRPEPVLRRGALTTLGELGGVARVAVFDVARLVQSAPGELAATAAWALGRIGPGAPGVADVLRGALEDGRPELVEAAVEALGGCGVEGRAAAPRLLELFAEGVAEAGRTLGRLGAVEAVGALVEALGAEERARRVAALEGLKQLGPQVLPEVAGALRLPEAGSRAAAARVLGSWGAGAAPAVGALEFALSDAEAEVRLEAARSLGKVGAPAGVAVATLQRLLDDPDPELRLAAIEALGGIGEAARASAPRLIEALRESSGGDAAVVAEALVGVGGAPEQVAPVWVDQLDDPDPERRRWAERGLRGLGEAAVPALRTRLRGGDGALRLRVSWGLSALGEGCASAMDEWVRALRDPEWAERGEAVAAIEAMGECADPVLDQLLRDPSGTLRLAAARSLRRRRGPQPSLVPALHLTLEDPMPEVRAASVEVLGRVDPAAVPALIAALDDPSAEVRLAAARTLRDRGPAVVQAVEGLIVHLGDPDVGVRRVCVEALVAIGQPAVSPLLRARERDDLGVRHMAEEALRWLEVRDRGR